MGDRVVRYMDPDKLATRLWDYMFKLGLLQGHKAFYKDYYYMKTNVEDSFSFQGNLDEPIFLPKFYQKNQSPFLYTHESLD